MVFNLISEYYWHQSLLLCTEVVSYPSIGHIVEGFLVVSTFWFLLCFACLLPTSEFFPPQGPGCHITTSCYQCIAVLLSATLLLANCTVLQSLWQQDRLLLTVRLWNITSNAPLIKKYGFTAFYFAMFKHTNSLHSILQKGLSTMQLLFTCI